MLLCPLLLQVDMVQIIEEERRKQLVNSAKMLPNISLFIYLFINTRADCLFGHVVRGKAKCQL
jgi:hypothetical protein